MGGSQKPKTPEGLKYSLVYIDPHGRRVLGYENAEGKGHHRHEGGKEITVSFLTIEGLIDQFLEDVKTIRGKSA